MVGTLVWDRIVPAPSSDDPVVEAWGGIGYALAAAAAAFDGAGTLRPLVKVGHDLEVEARAYLATLPSIEWSGLRTVGEPNNRVELRYRDVAHRTERLSGGVPAWTGAELVDAARGCDALLVNFVSGHEASLGACRELRDAFGGPVYADLHSLFLATDADGTRVPRALPDFGAWMACFDAVQLNADEARLASGGGDPEELIAGLVAGGLQLAAVTLGPEGASWAARESVAAGSGLGARREAGARNGGRVEVGSVTIGAPRLGDPTGCGDVWGAAFFARLLRGDRVRAAADLATRLAGRSVEHRGAGSLYDVLHAEVLS